MNKVFNYKLMIFLIKKLNKKNNNKKKKNNPIKKNHKKKQLVKVSIINFSEKIIIINNKK